MEWIIRLPAEGDVLGPSRSRSFYLDIVTQRFISSNTSMSLHTPDSLLVPRFPQHSLIMDSFMPGTNLSRPRNDNNWITDLKRERIFEQVAGWMTELAALEFDQIGRLDWDGTSGIHHVVPFPDMSAFIREIQGREELDTAVFAPPIHSCPFT